jgi:hypothetical protein
MAQHDINQYGEDLQNIAFEMSLAAEDIGPKRSFFFVIRWTMPQETNYRYANAGSYVH